MVSTRVRPLRMSAAAPASDQPRARMPDRSGTHQEQARRLYEAAFVVVSADASTDPLLTYGNRTALGIQPQSLQVFRYSSQTLTININCKQPDIVT